MSIPVLFASSQDARVAGGKSKVNPKEPDAAKKVALGEESDGSIESYKEVEDDPMGGGEPGATAAAATSAVFAGLVRCTSDQVT